MQRTDLPSQHLTALKANALMPNFDKEGCNGLVRVITQDAKNNNLVLMDASVDKNGFLETLATGYAVYWSKSRKGRWAKGETSGNRQKIVDVLVNCDGSSVIYLVEQTGEGACHTNAYSCFYRRVVGGGKVMDVPKPTDKDTLPVEYVEVQSSLLL